MKKLIVMMATVLLAVIAAPVGSDAADHRDPPLQIDLPSGFFPEGIAAGSGATFYVSSLADGSISKGNFRTGEVEPLTGPAGPFGTVGINVDRFGRVWAAGGPTGQARIYDGRTGELLATYQLTAPLGSFINDVVIHQGYAWFTDSGTQNSPDPDNFQFAGQPRLFRIPVSFRPAGPDAVVELPVDIPDLAFPNLNGIESSPDGRRLLVAHSTLSTLFNVNFRDGSAVEVDYDTSFQGADGLRRRGKRLFIANGGNLITELVLNQRGTEGTFKRTLVAQGAEITTTIAIFAGALYLPDARFFSGTDPYKIYRVSLSCESIRARGAGQLVPAEPGDPEGLVRLEASIFSGPLKGRTESALTIVDPGPPVAIGGELTFLTERNGTMTVAYQGGADFGTGDFFATTPIIGGTGPLAGAHGVLSFEGVQDLSDPAGSFTEVVSGEICSDIFR